MSFGKPALVMGDFELSEENIFCRYYHPTCVQDSCKWRIMLMTTWDYTTDVLVVGSGGGGMTTALDIIEFLK